MGQSATKALFERMGLSIHRSEVTKEWEVVKKGGSEVFSYMKLADARWHWEVALIDLLVAHQFHSAIVKASERWPSDDVDAAIRWLQMEPNVIPARISELQGLRFELPRHWRSKALKLCAQYHSNPEDAMAKSSLNAAVAIRDRLTGECADGRTGKSATTETESPR